MIKSLPYKTKQFFFVLIKLSIVVVAFYFIYDKLTKNTSLRFSVFIDFLARNDTFSIKNILLLIILSFFNWFFEILKWQNLMAPLKKTTFKEALEQSLGALTASLFTPNRIGEYGAKAMYYSSHLRKRVMGINLISNALQMAITCILGVIGFSLLITEYEIPINYFKLAKAFTFILIVILLIGLGINHKKVRTKGGAIQKLKDLLINYPKSKLGLGLLFSLIRYAIFSFQFYMLLRFFDVNISYLIAMTAITSMYLIASIIPSIFIFDVVIKGSIAVYLFAFIGVDEITILTIVTLMWLLNFVLPSVFGSYYVLKFKLPKQTVKA
ncbi:MAG: lysylphosphatidylglycerol synthase domain-containing protein [Algibacter sp.]